GPSVGTSSVGGKVGEGSMVAGVVLMGRTCRVGWGDNGAASLESSFVHAVIKIRRAKKKARPQCTTAAVRTG
ncbi:MAG: hypothetical protein ACK2T3_03100, partial [Candidatus Promineifilaceae bacterium]